MSDRVTLPNGYSLSTRRTFLVLIGPSGVVLQIPDGDGAAERLERVACWDHRLRAATSGVMEAKWGSSLWRQRLEIQAKAEEHLRAAETMAVGVKR